MTHYYNGSGFPLFLLMLDVLIGSLASSNIVTLVKNVMVNKETKVNCMNAV